MNIIADIEVEGLDYMPTGNILAASNHLGRLDTAALLCVVDREDIIMAVAEKYKDHFLFGAIGRAVDAIWLNRFEADFAALREILVRMKKRRADGDCPRRYTLKNSIASKRKMGVAFLASKSGYPVIPVALTGTEDAGVIANLKKFRKSKIKIKVGKEMQIQIPSGKGREEAMQQATDEIMCQIASMLPESYRGVYADHPRTKELLNQN
ncbi:MAG: putative acyltransferase [Chloroflexi bacterium OLB14]|nr:MAG: putative acyltransferase [Chloroflexi bacterium OLB14]